MNRIHFVVEGETEETFVRDVLQPYFAPMNYSLNTILLGGVSPQGYRKIKNEVRIKCLEDQDSFVTTMIDLYALPRNFPGQSDRPATVDPFQIVAHLENCFAADICCRNFIPNLLLHEFEAVLFTDPEKFGGWFDAQVVQAIQSERNGVPSPEHINEHPTTAPSKRLLRHCTGYDKILHGSLIALDIGLDTIRSQCSHFNAWIEKLVQTQSSGT